MSRPDHLATVVALRQLAGRELPLHQRLGNTVDAVQQLETATRSWRAFTPRLGLLDAAIAQADAVARAMRELRGALVAEQEGPPDAA